MGTVKRIGSERIQKLLQILNQPQQTCRDQLSVTGFAEGQQAVAIVPLGRRDKL